MRSNGRRAAIKARLAELDSRHTELEAALAAIEDESASRVDEPEALASTEPSGPRPVRHRGRRSAPTRPRPWWARVPWRAREAAEAGSGGVTDRAATGA